MCEESASFDITPYDLASGIEAIGQVLKEQAEGFQQNDHQPEFNIGSAPSGLCGAVEWEVRCTDLADLA